MSDRVYTSTVEIDLECVEGLVAIRYCDTSATYWEGEQAVFTSEGDSELIRSIANSISDEATELARSLVADLRRRTNIS